MASRIVIVDNPPFGDLRSLQRAFQHAAGDACRVDLIRHGEGLLESLKRWTDVKMVVLDDVLNPDYPQGVTMFEALQEGLPDLPIVVIVTQNNVANGAELIARGAQDFIVWGDHLQHHISSQLIKIEQLLKLMAKNRDLEEHCLTLRQAEQARYQMIGRSPEMQEVFQKVQKVATIPRPVLITGERGTGKELVARAIHAAAFPPGRPIVVVNCAAFSDNLLESELFGHEKGAFTGAGNRHPGKIRAGAKRHLVFG